MSALCPASGGGCPRPHSRPRPRQSERGVVVAMVLIIVAGIAFIGYEAMRLTRLDLASSAVLRARLADEGLLDAGLALACQILTEDTDQADGPFDAWNYLPERIEALSLHFSTGEVTGIIEDEAGRFPVNMMHNHANHADGPHGLLTRLLEVLVLAHGMGGSHTALADEIANWVRPESSDLDAKYLSHPNRIRVPHRPMRSLDELLMILWPGSAPGDLEKLYHGTEHVPGLKDLATVFSTEPLNLNTADKLLLFAATTGDDMALRVRFVNSALNHRANPRSALSWRWYAFIAGQEGLRDQTFLSSVYGYQSNVFRVTLTARVGSGVRHALAIVERQNGKVRILRKNF